MKRTFENYLIMIGIRAADYTYTDEQIFDNTEYFKKCFEDNLSAYKALLFLHDHLQELINMKSKSIKVKAKIVKVEKYKPKIVLNEAIENEVSKCVKCGKTYIPRLFKPMTICEECYNKLG